MIVRLTLADRVAARDCARRMIANGERIGAADRFGSPSEESHYLGALGEIGFARFMGLDWHCELRGTGGRPDVAGYEVRTISTTNPRPYLKVAQDDVLDLLEGSVHWSRAWMKAVAMIATAFGAAVLLIYFFGRPGLPRDVAL